MYKAEFLALFDCIRQRQTFELSKSFNLFPGFGIRPKLFFGDVGELLVLGDQDLANDTVKENSGYPVRNSLHLDLQPCEHLRYDQRSHADTRWNPVGWTILAGPNERSAEVSQVTDAVDKTHGRSSLGRWAGDSVGNILQSDVRRCYVKSKNRGAYDESEGETCI